MGKPVSESRAEIEKCAWVCRYYADNGPAFMADEPLDSDAAFSYAAFRPLGVVLAVMPWNFPFWQVFRFAAPALTAGNGGALKHASNVSGCALAIESVMREAGYPEHLFRTLITGGDEVARAIASPHVQAATLTGSESAASRLINGGQSCIAAKRFIVVAPAREAFTRKFLAEMGKFNPGHPEDPGTRLGPLARDTDDAVRIANDSRFGLGAAVFTRDHDLGQAVAARLQCGFCAVNDFVKSDPRLPFGGIKASGYGRELSRQGMREFVNIQTVAGL